MASGRCRSLWETLKVSDDKVTHHSHQKGAFGLDGEVSFTPKRHRGGPRTGGLADCETAGEWRPLATLADSWRERYAVGTWMGPNNIEGGKLF